MKAISVEIVEGTYLGYKDYKGKGDKFPLITVFLWSKEEDEKRPVEILADRQRWADQGGNYLKVNKQRVTLSIGVYSIMQKGKEVIVHVFEDLLNVSDV